MRTSLAAALWAAFAAAAATQAAVPDCVPLDDAELAALSAGAETVTSTQQIVTATSEGNAITTGQMVSGTISFSDGAFGGFTGIGNVVVNTGSNNTIQGTLSVTVVTTPNM